MSRPRRGFFSLEDLERLSFGLDVTPDQMKADLARLSLFNLDIPPLDGERQRRRAASAKRKRTYRARQRSGRVVLRIEASEYELTLALIEAGFVSEEQSRDRQQIEDATSAVFDRWVKTWMAQNSR